MIPVVTATAYGQNRGGPQAFQRDFRRIRFNPDGPGPALTPEQQAAHDHMLALLAKAIDDQGQIVKAEAPANVIVVVLAGAAGTGKTTLMRNLMASLKAKKLPTFLMAPTGKAASRLKQVTGEETRTIHGTFFSGAETVGVCPSCGGLSSSLAILPAIAIRRGMSSVRCEKCGASFPVPDGLVGIERVLQFKKGEEMPDVAVAIVDESSMISKKLYEDMMARVPTNWRILFVGDKEQLQPVVKRGEPEGWGVGFDKPDVTLTKVLRQAAGNPIIQLATLIRTGETGTSYFALDPELIAPDPRLVVRSVPTWEPAVRDYISHRLARLPDRSWDTDKQDVVMLTFMNAARRLLNTMIREQLILPQTGKSVAETAREKQTAFTTADRLLITFNNHAQRLMNGEVYSVLSADYIDERAYEWGLLRLTLRMYDGTSKTVFTRDQAVGMSPDVYDIAFYENRQRYNDVSYAAGAIIRDKDNKDPLAGVPPDALWREARCVQPWRLIQCDYGDCISIVKSQGSQWKNVVIVWDSTTQWLMEKKAKEGDEYGRRLAYTALTRASETAHIYLVNQKKPFDPVEDFEDKFRSNRVKPPDWLYEPTVKLDRQGLAPAGEDAMSAARRVLKKG